MSVITSSTPSYEDFNPNEVPYQMDVIDDIYNNYDLKLGVHTILLSGSAGSAKSILMAHLIVRHCVENAGARVLIGRRVLQDLRETLYLKICEHLDRDFIEKKRPSQRAWDYKKRDQTCGVKFKNGSVILARTWADKNYQKFRSLELSMAAIEELTENNEDDRQAFEEISLRVGRLPHLTNVPNLFLNATNPDEPSHWVYETFQLGKSVRKATYHVYYSKTEDNKFLPDSYINQMKENLDPLMYQRMGLGLWLSISKHNIYHQYGSHNKPEEKGYVIDSNHPIHINWDFNIAENKPLSLCLFQFINNIFHVYGEVVVEGADTEESCSELVNRGYLNHDTTYLVHGDATGSARSTTSKRSDYDIIKKFMANHINQMGDKLLFKMEVPTINPPIRTRHNIVNSYCRNALDDIRLKVYDSAPTVDKGMKLTAFKKGSNIEDDSKPWQHVTTALGYGICWVDRKLKENKSRRKNNIQQLR